MTNRKHLDSWRGGATKLRGRVSCCSLMYAAFSDGYTLCSREMILHPARGKEVVPSSLALLIVLIIFLNPEEKK